ncbi:MAG TPA: class I SAM-dependent methyltransferase [Candidatus Polarisedimenticolaceae bacterium]|nr:class I SAM-dependent methyltransferase [Candidatus Polarisedimenticolaceae bacterium]
MTRGFDDWSGWIRGDRDGGADDRAPYEIVNEILAAVRDRQTKTVACFGRPTPARLRFLAQCFARVVAIDRRAGEHDPAGDEPNVEYRRRAPFDLEATDRGFDVALVIASLDQDDLAEIDRRLSAIHASLAEGGLMIASVPAAPRGPAAREMRLAGRADGPPRAFHEVELQYRLRRAGFRGVRVRRFGDEDASIDQPRERLLSVAVRRANN